MDTASVIKRLGPVVPVAVCDSLHYSYTDGASSVDFDGLDEITFDPRAEKISRPTAKPRDPQIRPLASNVPTIRTWTFMGQPIFSKPARLPGFIVLKPGRGEFVHWYRPGAPRIDYYRLADRTVEISSDGPNRD